MVGQGQGHYMQVCYRLADRKAEQMRLSTDRYEHPCIHEPRCPWRSSTSTVFVGWTIQVDICNPRGFFESVSSNFQVTVESVRRAVMDCAVTNREGLVGR